MENSEIKALTAQVQLLVETNKEFRQKIQQRLFLESSHVKNPYKFIAGLVTTGVLCDGSPDPDPVFGLREMMVQHAMMISCSKGAEAVGGLMKALEGSGNNELISALSTWTEEDCGFETDASSSLYDFSDLSEPDEDALDVQSPPKKKLRENVTSPTELRSIGSDLMDMIVSRVDEEGFMEKLEGHLVGRACDIVNAAEFCSSLADQNVIEQTNIELTTDQEVEEGEGLTERAMKAVCSKQAFGRLVIALQSSNNARILAETHEWLENQQIPLTGLFVATSSGLMSLNLRTLEATALTRKFTSAVAVNHNLKKVYWAENRVNSRIMRSNFDGLNAEKVIEPVTGDRIDMMAIDEASGNLYFAGCNSQEIKICNALGQNCAVVISDSSLVQQPVGIALDSVKGFMYWGTGEAGSHSLVRANLDGSNTTIISTGFSILRGITLDQPSNDVIYWADVGKNTIGTIDVKGGNKRTLVELEEGEGNPAPWRIQVDTHKIYFSNYFSGNIQSVNRDSGEELTTIFKYSGVVNHLVLFSSPVT